jgi:hypothetical protein
VSPLGGVAGVVVGEATAVLGAGGDEVPGLDVFDEPHAATDNAVAPAITNIVNRVDINVPPQSSVIPDDRVYPLELCGSCASEGVFGHTHDLVVDVVEDAS